MRIRMLWLMPVFLLAVLAAAASALADCDPWGANTLMGDARYPEGWITGFGVIEISPPDEFVYAVIDGAAAEQAFTMVKAKLRSRIVDRVTGPGTVTAIARYYLRTDYASDLSHDPPTLAGRQETPSASISMPVSVDELPSDNAVSLTFDFSAQPIPAGITDLYFMVMYRGAIEGIDTEVTAIGLKDLNEPHHVLRWNNTDWFLLNYRWYTGQQIRSDADLTGYLTDHCWFMDQYVDPMDMELFVGFTAAESDEPVYTVHYQSIPPGRFGRLIFIADAQEIWMHARSVTRNPDDTLEWVGVMPGVVNQVDASGFKWTAPYQRRHIIGHSSIGWSWACPADEPVGPELDEALNSKEPADQTPVPITDIYFP